MHCGIRLVHRPLVRLENVAGRLANSHNQTTTIVLGDLVVRGPPVGADPELVYDVGAEGDQPGKQEPSTSICFFIFSSM